MTCGDCGKLLVERTVATKTKKVDGDVIVLAQRQALVCDEHGVVAWDPTHPVSYPVPYVPYVPQPWINPRPWGTWPPIWSGKTTQITPISMSPTITYGSAATSGTIPGTCNINRALASAS